MSEPLRVLIIEDSENDAILTLRALRQGGWEPQHVRVDSAAAMRAALSVSPWDVILSDYDIPGFGGAPALALRNELAPQTPFILLSGTAGEEIAVEALKSGATDYVIKNRLHRLAPAIQLCLEEARARAAARRAEAELAQLHERYDLAWHLTRDVIGDFNQDDAGAGWFSDTMRVVFGWPERTVPHVRAWWLDRVHPEDARRVDASLREAEAGTTDAWAGEYRFRKADGSFAIVTDQRRLMRRGAGQPMRVICVLADVTEQRRLQAQLSQAQRLESVARLTGGIAHDFNNMLTVINGYCEIALQRLEPEEPLHLEMSEIFKAGRRAATLTRRLLAFSRPHPEVSRAFDPDAVLRDVEMMLRRLIGEDVALSLALEAHGCVILADPGQIEQVAMNLAVNARDAMPRGGSLRFETTQVHVGANSAPALAGCRPGLHWALAVTDTGMGMSAETAARIFEPFFTTKEPGKGTGLGLMTVYAVVRQCGGAVLVDSIPGQGTVFRLYFPLTTVATQAEAPPQPAAAVLRGTETVLVVEDEDSLRRLVRIALESFGYRVLLAADGVEALEVGQRHTGAIDLLVTDMVMPRMGGRELAERLSQTRPAMCTLFVSGYAVKDVPAAAPRRAPSGSLIKPFSGLALVAKVRETLDADTARTEGSTP